MGGTAPWQALTQRAAVQSVIPLVGALMPFAQDVTGTRQRQLDQQVAGYQDRVSAYNQDFATFERDVQQFNAAGQPAAAYGALQHRSAALGREYEALQLQERNIQESEHRIYSTGFYGLLGYEKIKNPSAPTESMSWYGFYQDMKSRADWWNTSVVGPYEKHIASRLPWGGFATGLLRSPAIAMEIAGMVPAGMERMNQTRGDIPGYALAGLGLPARAIHERLTERPQEFAGEMIGLFLLTRGASRAVAASPVRFAVGRAGFPAESYTSLGLETTRGNVVGFRPLAGIGRTAEGLRPTVGTPKIDIAGALGSERFTPATPFESRIVQTALGGVEGRRIGLARDIRTVTQSSGLTLKEATPVIREVVDQHGIPNPGVVSKTIVKALRDDGAELYGSVVQRGIGQEAGGVGLSRIPRDFDVRVTNTRAFQSKIVADINRAAGREVVIPEGKAGVLVKQTGKKLFDLHDLETAAAERQFTPKSTSEYIAFGIKGENLVKTQEGISAITLSEQATRKLEGSMQLSAYERTYVKKSVPLQIDAITPKEAQLLSDITIGGREHLIVQTKYGEALGENVGSTTRVGLPKNIDIEGMTVTHTHPPTKLVNPLINPFSMQDILTGIHTGLRFERLLTPKGLTVAEFPMTLDRITLGRRAEVLFKTSFKEAITKEIGHYPKSRAELAQISEGQKATAYIEGIRTAVEGIGGSYKFTPIESLKVIPTNPGQSITGRLLPKHEGRIKDIADYYFAEKLAIDVMQGSRSPVKMVRATLAERNLNQYLETWGSDVAGSVKAQYATALSGGELRVRITDPLRQQVQFESQFRSPEMASTSMRGHSSYEVARDMSPSYSPSQSPGMASINIPHHSSYEVARSMSPSYSQSQSSEVASVSIPRYSSYEVARDMSPSYMSVDRGSSPSSSIITTSSFERSIGRSSYLIPSPSPSPSPGTSRSRTFETTSFSLPVFPIPRSRFRFEDERKTRGIRLNLSLKGFDWTVENPVPTFESVFGSSFATKPLKMPKFRLPKFRF